MKKLKVTFLDESFQVQTAKGLKELMKAELQKRMAGKDFRSFLVTKLTSKNKLNSSSFVLTDGKFGNYYIDEKRFFISFSIKTKINDGNNNIFDKITNVVYLALISKDSSMLKYHKDGLYCPVSSFFTDNSQEARNLIYRMAKNPEQAYSILEQRKKNAK